MASIGGKKGKQKWKAMDIGKVETTTSRMNWADEVDKEFSNVLPTAPRASRGNIVDESKIPNNGPFQAHLSNIPYEIHEDELGSYFQDLKIKSVKIPRKGFAYIEFNDRQSLITALNLGETNIKGRTTRIELSTHGLEGGRGGMGGRPGGGRGGGRDGGLRDPLPGPDRTSGNWRQGSRPEDDDRGHDRGSMGGGSRREFSSSSFSRGYGGGFDSGRSFSDHYGDRSERPYRSGGFKDDDKDRYNSRDDRSRGMDDRFGKYDRSDRDRDGKYMPRRDDRPDPPKGDSKMTRPKLNLKPRSETTEPASVSVGNQSIFGGAKPVDTLTRDLEIEKRLAKHSEHYDARGGKPSAPSSGRSKGDNWSDNRRVEPAPLPKDNAWGKTNNPPVNNGRSSPDKEIHPNDLPEDDDSGEEADRAENEPRRQEAETSDDTVTGKGCTTAGNVHKGGVPEKSRGKETERQPAHKQRDSRREPGDELARMPKVQEASTPNFVGQNKFSSLVPDESCID